MAHFYMGSDFGIPTEKPVSGLGFSLTYDPGKTSSGNSNVQALLEGKKVDKKPAIVAKTKKQVSSKQAVEPPQPKEAANEYLWMYIAAGVVVVGVSVGVYYATKKK